MYDLADRVPHVVCGENEPESMWYAEKMNPEIMNPEKMNPGENEPGENEPILTKNEPILELTLT